MAIEHVIVLVVDRLGAGWLGPYGNTWLDTPNFNRLAAQSAVIETAIAVSPGLDACCRSFWTGRHPLEPDAERTLPALVAATGRSSLLLSDDARLAELPLAAQFAERRVLPVEEAAQPAEELEQTGLFRFFDAARMVIGGPNLRALTWLHTRGLAGPWDAPLALRYQFADEDDPQPPDFVTPPDRILPEGYDPDELLGIVHAHAGQVALLDLCFGLLLDAMEESAHARDAALLVTSPRGFPLGEHRRVGPCDHALFGELLHVPLFVRLPDGEGPLRLHSIVHSAEVWRVACELFEFGTDAREPTSRLLREIRTGEIATAAACSVAPGQRAIRTPAWFLRQSNTPEGMLSALFAKPDDRFEANEIASRCSDIAELLAARLDEFEALAKAGNLAELGPLVDLLSDAWR